MEQLLSLKEQYEVLRGATSSLRLSRLDLLILSTRQVWNNQVLRPAKSWLEMYSTVSEQFAVLRGAMASLRLSRQELAWLTLRKAIHDMSPNFRRVIVLAILVLLIVIFDRVSASLFSLHRRVGLPVLKFPPGKDRWDYANLLAEGAAKFPNSPYIISYSGYEYVVYPSSSFDEIKRVSVKKASMLEFFTHVFFNGWRFLGTDTGTLLKTIGVDLTRAVPVRIHARQDDARRAFDRTVGRCEEWKSFPLYWTVQSIVAGTNASGLVGPEIGNDPRWIRMVQVFPMATALAVYISNAVPRLIRPLFALFVYLPAWYCYSYMKAFLKPMVQSDLQEYERAKSEQDRKEILRATPDKKFPIAAWLTSRYTAEERGLDQVIHDIIVATFESTPSTAGTLYFILAELVSRPELVEELHDELSQVMSDGKLPQTNLTELRKMDSMMRESSRVNPFSLLVLFRRLRQSLQLSIGPKLPPGSLICVDAHNIHNSTDLWDKPEVFDPMRFLKLRESHGIEARHQFTSLGNDSPGWGDGTQACPGRVFAGNTIKIILAHLITHYDIQLPPGADKPMRHSMPNGSMAPDLWAKIMIREKRVKA